MKHLIFVCGRNDNIRVQDHVLGLIRLHEIEVVIQIVAPLLDLQAIAIKTDTVMTPH